MSEYYFAHDNDLDGATRAHRVRYHIARGFIEPEDTVLDASCGCGYGSEMLSEVAAVVIGVDQHQSLVDHANVEHGGRGAVFFTHNFNDAVLSVEPDVSVSLETLEHLRDPEYLIQTLKQAKRWMIVSVPHTDSVGINMFHFHDYTSDDIKRMFEDEHWMLWHSITQGVHGMYFFKRI